VEYVADRVLEQDRGPELEAVFRLKRTVRLKEKT
jgi:hypothetical protein